MKMTLMMLMLMMTSNCEGCDENYDNGDANEEYFDIIK